MPWRCPACRIAIHHNEVEERPHPKTVYRCHVCRLELIVDPATGRLVVASQPDGTDEKTR